MKRILLAATIVISLFFFVSCYYDNEEALYPTLSTSCDTTNITYTSTIVPILSSNCYSCHSDANAAFGGGVHLQQIADVITNSSKIIPSVKRTGTFPMPPAGKLNSCSITQLEIWIRNGTPNN